MKSLLDLADEVKNYLAKRVPGTKQFKQAWKPVVQKAKPYVQNVVQPTVQAFKQGTPSLGRISAQTNPFIRQQLKSQPQLQQQLQPQRGDVMKTAKMGVTGYGLTQLTPAWLGASALLGGGFNKAFGGSFLEGATKSMGHTPLIAGMVGLTNPVLSKVIGKLPIKAPKVVGRGAGAIANVAQGLGIDKATGLPTTPSSVGLDIVTGLVGGKGQFDMPKMKLTEADIIRPTPKDLKARIKKSEEGIEFLKSTLKTEKNKKIKNILLDQIEKMKQDIIGNKKVLNEVLKEKTISPPPKVKVKASEEFKVGDVLDPQGNTNMAGKVRIRAIEGNTLKFTDAKGTNYAGMQRSLVRDLVGGGSWKKVTQQPVAKAKIKGSLYEVGGKVKNLEDISFITKDGKLVGGGGLFQHDNLPQLLGKTKDDVLNEGNIRAVFTKVKVPESVNALGQKIKTQPHNSLFIEIRENATPQQLKAITEKFSKHPITIDITDKAGNVIKSAKDIKASQLLNFVSGATQPKAKIKGIQPDEALKTTKAQIGEIKPVKKGFKQSLSEFYTNWVNRTQPVESLEKGVEKELNASIRPKFRPTIQIKKLFGAGGKAELRHKQKLQPILDSVKNVAKDDFDAFMKAQRDIELGDRGIKGSDPELAKQTIEALGQKYNINQLKQAADKLYAYQRENLEMLKQSGFLSDEAMKSITSVNQKYVPFERIMDEVNNYLGLPTSKLQQTGQPIKKIKGSVKQILSPVESIIANTYKTEAAVAKNNVAKSIVNLKNLLPELPITKSKEAKGAITIWENGKKTYYQVPIEIENVVKGLNEDAMDGLTKVLSAPARILRQQATGRNLEFMIPNIVRDQFEAAINTKYGYKPFIGYLEGLRHMLNYKLTGSDDIVEAWINSGGKIFFESMEGRKAISKQVSDTSRRGILKQIGEWIIGGIETVGELSESPTRVGLFKQGLRKTGNIDLAMMEAREATLDFARRGAKMKTANALVPFLNVGVQGFDRMLRTVKNNPGGTALAILAYGAVPATAVAIYNNMFHGEDWQNVPDFEKQGNFVILTGNYDEEGNAKYIKIPKAYGQRYVANPIQELITFAAGNNPQGFKQFALNYIGESLPILEGGSTLGEAVSKTVGSNLPQFAKIPTQLAANYDFFRAKPIVPWYLKDKPPAEQSYKNTEGAYKKLGQILEVSPLKVKNALESTLAGGATQPKNIYKTVDALLTGKKPSPNDLFILRRFIGSYSGFDTERPIAKEKQPLISRIFEPTSKAKASESALPEELPEEIKDLKVLYKDALNKTSKYAENKVKVKHGLVTTKTLEDYQKEADAAIAMKRKIEKERPEQVFEIELDIYKSGGGQTTEERAKWAGKKLKTTKDKKEFNNLVDKMLESKVLTKSVVKALNEAGISVDKYIEGGKIKSLSGKGKTKSAKKVTIPKLSVPKVSTGKISFKRATIKVPQLKKLRVAKPKVSRVKYEL